MLLGVVGVQDYGDKLNDDLRERFDVSTDDFPVFKLFGSGDVKTFSGDVTEENLKRFIKNECGIWLGLEGCLEEFDMLAEKFMKAANADRPSILDETVAAGDTLQDEAAQVSAKVYVRVMKKVLSKGEVYLSTEPERLQRLIDGNISEGKKEEFRKRLNILPSFPQGRKEEL